MINKLIKRVIAVTMSISLLSSPLAMGVYAKAPAEITLTSEQDSAIAMLNYLTVVTKEVNESSNSKISLEEMYSTLINNTSPSAIDSKTKRELNDILDTIETYRMIDVKRERLQFLYEREKAMALRKALPNPVGLLSSTQSYTLKGLIASVVYMAIDSASSYETAKGQADLQYLKDGWELDDEAYKALTSSRKNLFNYRIDMVKDNNIPDKYALNEENVNKFVEYENEPNLTRRIQFLESSRSTYEHFGDYWLLCAKSYYEDENYEECLNSIDAYDRLDIKIFTKDYNYASVLPLAIVSAQEVYDGNKQEERVRYYLSKLLANAKEDNWSLRYFAAQTYIDLYAKTKNETDLHEAYKIVKDNVNNLIDEQNSLNAAYLSEVKVIKADKDATKEQKKEVNAYNKMLKEIRKKELPPVSEALYLNCDLLFALADQLDISESEQKKIEKLLHNNGDKLFLIEPLEENYYFSTSESSSEYDIKFKKTEMEIPVMLLSEYSSISVEVFDSANKTDKYQVTDWNLEKVTRDKKGGIESFYATYTSKEAKDVKYVAGQNVTITILPVENASCKPVVINYQVKEKKVGFVKTIEFERQ